MCYAVLRYAKGEFPPWQLCQLPCVCMPAGGLLALRDPLAITSRRAAMAYGERFTAPHEESAPDRVG